MTLRRLILEHILPLASHMFLCCGWDKRYHSHFADEETQYREIKTPLSQAWDFVLLFLSLGWGLENCERKVRKVNQRDVKQRRESY